MSFIAETAAMAVYVAVDCVIVARIIARHVKAVTIRYDTRCYFNVRSKADVSQLNLYRTETTTKKCKREKLKSDNGYAHK